jgi:hypothetical protein
MKREIPKKQSKRSHPASRTKLHIWSLQNEAPGTLIEIFAAEDSRRQNLVLEALKEANAFQKCSDIIGAFDSHEPAPAAKAHTAEALVANRRLFFTYDLISAVGSGIACHLGPKPRPSSFGHNNRRTAKFAREAATALENLSASFKELGGPGWGAPELWGFPDPTDERTIKSLRNLADGLDGIFDRGTYKEDIFTDTGGRPKKIAFQRLIAELAGAFERATGKRATIWKNHQKASGYDSAFLKFVEVVLPVVRSIIQKSGVDPLDEPISSNRGEFINSLLMARRRRKTPTAAS